MGGGWRVRLLCDCDSVGSEMRGAQKGFSQEGRCGRHLGLFPCRRGQLGREGASVRKEWDRGREDRVCVRRVGQAASRVGPCCLVLQKENLGWREDLFPASSPWDRRAPCLFLFKERGRPTSLPRAYLCCFLIFQSSDFMALCVYLAQQGSPTTRGTIPSP